MKKIIMLMLITSNALGMDTDQMLSAIEVSAGDLESNSIIFAEPAQIDKKFVCPYDGCHKQFDRKNSFKRHVNIHTKEKQYVCTYEACDKVFNQKDELTAHEVVHTGKKISMYGDWLY